MRRVVLLVLVLCAVPGFGRVAQATAPAGYNGKIVFAGTRNGQSDIYTVDADGSHLTNLTNDAAADAAAVWSPDGNQIAFASSRQPSGIYVMNADGSGAHRISNGTLWLAWSGDGSRLATSFGDRIWIMNADGSDLHAISSGPQDFFPSWSTDGQLVTFEHVGAPDAGIALVGADGSNQHTIVADAGSVTYQAPSLSSDGSAVYFDAPSDNSHAQIMRAGIDGSNVAALSDSAAFNAFPRLSPDGAKLLYMTGPSGDGPFRLVLADADGANPKPITDTGFDAEFPDWQRVASPPSSTSTSTSTPTSTTSIAPSRSSTSTTRPRRDPSTTLQLARGSTTPTSGMPTNDTPSSMLTADVLHDIATGSIPGVDAARALSPLDPTGSPETVSPAARALASPPPSTPTRHHRSTGAAVAIGSVILAVGAVSGFRGVRRR